MMMMMIMMRMIVVMIKRMIMVHDDDDYGDIPYQPFTINHANIYMHQIAYLQSFRSLYSR